ncbi:MAG: DDE-type integrase/transposase/recombinase [Mycetocola sp.]
MSALEPGPDVRLAVLTWPEDAPRGAVTKFCREHQVSRAWFYKVRALAIPGDPWPGLELESTRPKNSPNRTPAVIEKLALDLRAELKKAGWDHGPLSVQSALRRRGFDSPSRTTLSRIFTRAGVVIPEPRKRPRSAMRRFVYPAPNCCWQIDGTEWTLSTGRKAMVLQVIDDHSRRALATLAASGETSVAAIAVVSTAIARHGIPQKFLSDNGTAFNQDRRGKQAQLSGYLRSLGVQPISGKPAKPTTQGKNERFHGTLFKYLNAHPVAATLDELQDQVDTFDEYYNNQREHQALPPGTTPQEAWNATPKAPAPTPPDRAEITKTGSDQRQVGPGGVLRFKNVHYGIGKEHANTLVNILYDTTTIGFYDSRGTELISHPYPEPGVRYLGTGRPRFGGPGFRGGKPLPTEPSTKS